jgi:hypothetical protein
LKEEHQVSNFKKRIVVKLLGKIDFSLFYEKTQFDIPSLIDNIKCLLLDFLSFLSD